MLNSGNSVVCMMEAQPADIIRTANAFKSKSVFKLIGIVNNGFGPSNSENSVRKLHFPMDVLVILLQLILLSLKVSFFIISKHMITVHYFQVTKLANSKLT